MDTKSAASILGSIKSDKKASSSRANGKKGGHPGHYYAAHSYMGLNFTYDSPCWYVMVFDDKAARDAWVSDNEYDGQQYVAMPASSSVAQKIIGFAGMRDLRNGVNFRQLEQQYRLKFWVPEA